MTHRGRSLDAKARAREIALRFTTRRWRRSPAPRQCADRDAGLLRPTTATACSSRRPEQLLRAITDLDLVDGGESYPLADAPQLEVLAGETCRIFVTLELTAGAPGLTPNPFSSPTARRSPTSSTRPGDSR